MNKPTLLSSPKDVDLSRHAVIEASAGTGKTTTIVELVARLVSGDGDPARGLALGRILVVTFTERAASEMRERIRAKIQAIDFSTLSPQEVSRLMAFDEAMITTIHGFCRSVLAEYAFECGLSLSQTLVEDSELYLAMLHRIYRDWLTDPQGESLARLAGFTDKPRAFQKTVLKLAGLEDVLPPDAESVPPLSTVESLAQNALSEFVSALDLLRPYLQEINRLSQLEALPHHHKTVYKTIRTAWLTIYSALIQEPVSQVELVQQLLAVYSAVVENSSSSKNLQKNFQDLSGEAILTGGKKRNDLLPDSWPGSVPELAQVIEHLEAMRLLVQRIRKVFAFSLAAKVRVLGRSEKIARDQYSYDDMIRLVREAVERGGLTTRLRERYRVAMIDEFQDTDPSQWEIFRLLFAESPDGHTLCLIGDPKQAIYGFRGGDVATYFSACSYLVQEKQARSYTLEKNWRSNTALIQACNALFSGEKEEGWFQYYPGSGEVPNFYPSLHPDTPSTDWVTDAKPAPVVVFESAVTTQAANCFGLAHWIADEISAILAGSLPPVRFSDKPPRPLGAGDIAILVRSRHEAGPLLWVLHARRIPASLYKAGGLWVSPEALAVLALFDALSLGTPQALRLAFVSPFFSCPLDELESALSAESPQHVLLERWRELALARDWAALFAELERRSGIYQRLRTAEEWRTDAGVIDQRDDERRIANLRQLLSELLLGAEAACHGLEDLAALIRRRYQQAQALDDDEDIQPLESDAGKVRIMTMHAAKGLQFPLVFIGGGFSGFNTRGEYYEYYNDGGQKVFDLCKSQEGKELAQGYWQAEMQRLLYVALTRAMLRLYLPLLVQENNDNELLEVGPSRASSPLAGWPLRVALERCRKRASAGFVFSSGQTGVVGPALLEQGERRASRPDEDELARFERPLPEAQSLSEVRVDSFSALAALPQDTNLQTLVAELDSAAELSEVHEGESAGFKMDDELPRQLLAPPELEGLVCLPRGVESGTLVHAILEEAVFRQALEDEEYRQALVRHNLRRFRLRANRTWMERLYPDWNELSRDVQVEQARQEVVHWLDETLKAVLSTPIAYDGKELVLGNLEEADSLREVRFDEATPFLQRRFFAPFVTGSIDLLFRHEGRYYVLDWKTNWLEDYSAETMHTEMQKHRYGLQAALYAAAVRRWLVSRGLPTTVFGGVFYLFVRAFSPARYAEVRGEGGVRAASGGGVLFFSAQFLLEQAAGYGMEA